MLVRDIIDIDSTYEDFEASSDDDLKINKEKKVKKEKKKKDENEKKDENSTTEDDEFNVSRKNGRRN